MVETTAMHVKLEWEKGCGGLLLDLHMSVSARGWDISLAPSAVEMILRLQPPRLMPARGNEHGNLVFDNGCHATKWKTLVRS